MKPAILCLASLLTGLILLSGCATQRPTEQALVCPQCKEVTIKQLPGAFSEEDGLSRTYWEADRTRAEHSCPGCQGAITTLFKEGKWQHKCSICEQSAFSCPVSHR